MPNHDVMRCTCAAAAHGAACKRQSCCRQARVQQCAQDPLGAVHRAPKGPANAAAMAGYLQRFQVGPAPSHDGRAVWSCVWCRHLLRLQPAQSLWGEPAGSRTVSDAGMLVSAQLGPDAIRHSLMPGL